MTLDEAIQKHEIAAKNYEKLAKFYYKGLGKNQKSGDACQECAVKYRQFAEWLKELKQYREGTLPANDWIPVSERLPEKNMACLVSVGRLYLTQIAIYSDLMGTIDHKIFYQGDYGHRNFENITGYVKAWLPLPKTYDPQESEDEE